MGVRATLEAIRQELDGTEWSCETCARIAEHLRSAGEMVRDIDEQIESQRAQNERAPCGCCKTGCVCAYHAVTNGDDPRVCEQHMGRSHNGTSLVYGQCSYCSEINIHARTCPTGLGRLR